jgi:hypothetical protein
MCLDCGCGRAGDSHQDDRHITIDDVRAAAKASGIPTLEAARRIYDETKKAIGVRMLGGDFIDPPSYETRER